MKKIIYICNCCNHEIEKEGACIVPQYFDFATGKPVKEIAVSDEDMHFCMECTMKIVEEIIRVTSSQKTKVRSIKEDKKSENATETPKRKKIDAGKVMALHQAGWSNVQIADEIGATEQQVYKCIYYREKQKVSINQSQEIIA